MSTEMLRRSNGVEVVTIAHSPNLLKWVQALESGEYKQVTHVLTALARISSEEEPTVVGHCCLGVACEVAIKEGLKLKVDTAARSREIDEYQGATNTCTLVRTYDDQRQYLPPSVCRWLGFTPQTWDDGTPHDPDGHLYISAPVTAMPPDPGWELAGLNDRGGLNFAIIAGLIRAYGVELH